MTAHVNHDSERFRSWLRLAIVLVVFPLVFVYVVPSFEVGRRLYEGDRSFWVPFWLFAIALEWLTLGAVLATTRRPVEFLRRIGLVVRLSRAEIVTAVLCVSAALVLAVLGAGTPQDFLTRLPAGLRMFIPPSELEARLLWVAVAVTAAVCEETLWRGVVIGEWRRRGGSTAVAVLVSCLSFAFFHGGFEQGAVIFAYRFAVGLVFALIYLRAGNLKLVVLIHFLADASSLLAIQVD